MTKGSVSNRRSFLKVGALVAAPLAAAAGPALAADDRDARLARLQDEAALRDLHQTWLRRTNAGQPETAARLFADPGRGGLDRAVRSLAVTAEPDLIELAADGRSAVGRYVYAVESASALPQDCTLAQMAHAQGGGLVRRTERRELKASYVKADAGWAIAALELRPAQA